MNTGNILRTLAFGLTLAATVAVGADSRTNHMDSAFGVFSAHSPAPNQYFIQQMGWNTNQYESWVSQHFTTLGAHWERSTVELMWDAVEPVLGSGYNWSNFARTDGTIKDIYDDPAEVHWLGSFQQGGGNLRVPLDNTNSYAAFVQAAVERYDGDGTNDASTNVFVKWWQPANEILYWTSSNNWTVAQYVTYATLVSHAARAADPNANIVLMASVDGRNTDSFLTNVIYQLAPGHEFEAIDIHYWDAEDQWKMGIIPTYRSLLDSLGLTNVQIWCGEQATWVGDPNPGSQQSEEDQSRSLVKRVVWDRANGLDRFLWNELVDFHNFDGLTTSPWNSMGLISDGDQSQDDPSRLNTERVAYWAYKLLIEKTDVGRGQLVGTVNGVHNDSSIYAYQYTCKTNNSQFFILWKETGSQSVSVPVTGTVYTARDFITDRFGDVLQAFSVTASLGQVTFTLGTNPILLEAGSDMSFWNPTNVAPTVTITAPTNGFGLQPPATFTISATASDSDGVVTQVAFYANGSLISAPDKFSPYSVVWSNAPGGAYALTAVALDNRGDATTSAVVNVAVTAPDFTITAITLDPPIPVFGSTFTAYVTVTNEDSVSGDAGKLFVYTNKPSTVATNTTGTKSVAIGTLGAHTSKVITVSSISSGDATTKVFRAFVDAGGGTSESDESNNQSTLTYQTRTLTNLVINGPATLGENVTTQYSCTALYQGTNTDVTASATWSENSSFATVAAGGILKTTNTLTADSAFTLTASFGGKSTTKSVTIQNDLRPDFIVDLISLSPTGSLPAGKTFTAYVTVRNQGVAPGDGGYIDIWTNQAGPVTSKVHGTKYTSIGTITNGMAKLFTLTSITAPSTNSVCTFRAVADSQQTSMESDEANNQATLSYAVRILTNLVVTGPATIGENAVTQYVCTAMYNDGTNENVSAFATWSENSSVATISSSGQVRSTNTLTANSSFVVTATFAGKTATTNVTILNDLRPDFVVSAISLNPGGTLPAGKTFTAYVTVTNQGVVPGDGGFLDIWTNQVLSVTGKVHGTKNTSIGTVTNGRSKTFTLTSITAPFSNGVYTFRAYADSFQTTAESDDTNNQTTVAITTKVLTNLTITGTSTIGEGTNTAYTCIARFSDGSSEDVTAWTTWSDNSSFATLNSNGLLSTSNTITADSSATLTVSFGSMSATKSVTLQNDLRPDFLITSLSMSPTSPILTGASISTYVTVQNAGSALGDGGYVDVWTNRPFAVTNTGHGQSFQSIGTMMVGSNKIFTFTGLKVPTSNGVYVLRAYVDSQQSIAELLDTNNQSTLVYSTRSVTNLTISGATVVNESSLSQYNCTAFFSDGLTNGVASSVTWSENSSFASINSSGLLTTLAVTADKICTISASYGGKSTNKVVIIQNQ